VFENRVLWRVFEPKRNVGTGMWVKFENEVHTCALHHGDQVKEGKSGNV
jgi:hypothetical protein